MTVLPGDDSDVRTGLPPDLPEEMSLAGHGGALDLLLDMEMPLVVRFGTARAPLRSLLQLTAGSVIDLDPAPENSVDLLVNGRVVARGVAVSVRGNYGVRISEIAPAGAGFAAGLGLGARPLPERKES